MLTWSSSNNLAFNAAKMKAVLFTNSQRDKLHGYEQDVVKLKCEGKNINEFKLLGITVDKNLNWKKHINNTTKNGYATLNVLCKIKRYTPLSVRQQLVEYHILSKLDYCDELLFDIPKHMTKQLQKAQNAAAGFILDKYANINDVKI